EGNGAVELAGGGAEADPGAAQRGAVEVHAAAAADDGRARLLAHACPVDQPDQGGMARGNGPLRRADFQGRARLARILPPNVGVAVEAFFTVLLAGLDLDQADVESRVAVGREA